MSRTLTEAEAQADFSQVVTEVCGGAEILITRGNRPVARLLPLAKETGGRTAVATTTERTTRNVDSRTWAQKVAALKETGRRAWVVVPTIEEIIEARDEGRR